MQFGPINTVALLAVEVGGGGGGGGGSGWVAHVSELHLAASSLRVPSKIEGRLWIPMVPASLTEPAKSDRMCSPADDFPKPL